MVKSGYRFKPGGRLLSVLLGLAIFNALFAAVSIGSSVMQLGMLHRMAAGEDVSDAEIEANDLREAIFGFSSIPFYFVGFIVLLMTVYRANANAHALGSEGLSYTPGWCVGWFFVPIMNLFKPYTAIRDTWRASDPAHADWQHNRASSVVGTWWALHVLSSILGRVIFRLNMGAETVEDFELETVVTIVALLVEVALWAAVFVLFRQLFQMQLERRELFTGDNVPSCAACGEPLTTSDAVCQVCGADATIAAAPA